MLNSEFDNKCLTLSLYTDIPVEFSSLFRTGYKKGKS
jgi:hypothetical protein